jgi:hypothetical protein
MMIQLIGRHKMSGHTGVITRRRAKNRHAIRASGKIDLYLILQILADIEPPAVQLQHYDSRSEL